jgi:hypothetical protein
MSSWRGAQLIKHEYGGSRDKWRVATGALKLASCQGEASLVGSRGNLLHPWRELRSAPLLLAPDTISCGTVWSGFYRATSPHIGSQKTVFWLEPSWCTEQTVRVEIATGDYRVGSQLATWQRRTCGQCLMSHYVTEQTSREIREEASLNRCSVDISMSKVILYDFIVKLKPQKTNLQDHRDFSTHKIARCTEQCLFQTSVMWPSTRILEVCSCLCTPEHLYIYITN